MDYFVYILTNNKNKILYVGVTNNLKRRIYEHKKGLVEGFTKRYSLHKLVYFEQTTDVYSVILREKQIKKWTRNKKNTLINELNPNWEEIQI